MRRRLWIAWTIRLAVVVLAIVGCDPGQPPSTEATQRPQVADAALEVGSASPDAAAASNLLTEEEREAGWQLLFDGKSFAGWKNYGAPTDEVKGWVIREGALEFTRTVPFALLILRHLNPFARPALDLMTKRRFGDFELSIDWKIEPGGNSGIFYLVADSNARLGWTLAPEMQVLDDERHADGQREKRRAGDLYDVVASVRRMARPAGEWNQARIRVQGPRIEHWLNGEKVVEIDRGSIEWNRAIANSKHAGVEGFGLAREGHILLQDHGDAVWYRNIKIRAAQSGNVSPLPPKSFGKSLNLGSPSRTAITFSP
jgi:cytochrome c